MKPKTQINIDQPNDETRELAKAIYLSMPIVRHSEVAKKCGADIRQVKQWLVEGRWLELREQFHKSKFEKLIEEFGNPKDSARKYIELCDMINQQVEINVTVDRNSISRAKSIDTLKKAAAVLRVTHELKEVVYREVGLRKTAKKKRVRK